ncbi:MAG: class I SAM-dependent methyltransferase [Candidatus Acidiferrales bacterium]
MSLKEFTLGVLDNYVTTAAVAPSSRYLAQAMVAPLPLARTRVAVELGAGTGVMTHELLARLPQDATLFAFEVQPRFQQFLRRRFTDRRLALIDASAVTVGEELRRRGIAQVDAAVSSLGITYMSFKKRHAILDGLVQFFTGDSVFTQYHYVHGLLPWYQIEDGRLQRFDAVDLLKQYFRTLERKFVWRNVPPAFVFACRR